MTEWNLYGVTLDVVVGLTKSMGVGADERVYGVDLVVVDSEVVTSV